MSDQLYREALLERLANPVNKGVLEKPDFSARLVNPVCGDEVILNLKVKNGLIEQAVYSGNGCAISQVSASFLTEKVVGQSIAKIKQISEDDILETLGINPGPARLKCALLSLETLKSSLKND